MGICGCCKRVTCKGCTPKWGQVHTPSMSQMLWTTIINAVRAYVVINGKAYTMTALEDLITCIKEDSAW